MARTLDILDRLIAFPTVSRDGNIELIHYVSALLDEAGIASKLYVDDKGDRASLFATIGPQGPGGVVLSGHTDVVPVDGQNWSSDPFKLLERDGRYYGRGTADMKGFVAASLAAVIAAKDRPLSKPIHLALSHDEEIGCVGVRPMLEDLAKAGLAPEWVLVGEPTELQVATGHKGKIGAKLTCCGVAAHSALAPKGLNAIHLASDFISVLRGVQAELAANGLQDPAYDIPYTTVHAGVIRGGSVLNIVPDHCELLFEIRNLAEDNAGLIFDRLITESSRIRDEARKHAPSADMIVDVFNTYPGLQTAVNGPIASRASALSGVGTKIKVAFGTEGGLFQSALKTEVVVCGPGSMDQGHKPDEFVSRDQLQACEAMLARLVNSLAA